MTQPTIAQLHNLTDRAAHGLTADEQQRLRDGIARLERAEAAVDRAREAAAHYLHEYEGGEDPCAAAVLGALTPAQEPTP